MQCPSSQRSWCPQQWDLNSPCSTICKPWNLDCSFSHFVLCAANDHTEDSRGVEFEIDKRESCTDERGKVENSPSGSWRKQSVKIREQSQGPQSRLMFMRWVLVWKPSAEQENDSKANERTVIRGYQHPEVTALKVSSPTLSRLQEMLTLQWTALNRPELERADAKPAFLHDDGQEVRKARTCVCENTCVP